MQSIDLPIPIPTTEIEVFALTMGFLFAQAFGKKLDQDIQASKWFSKQKPWLQWILKRSLDFLHHWWIGYFLYLYFPNNIEIQWFGIGIFIDDSKDIPRRFRGYFTFFKKPKNNVS